jgi:hypothetical protein
MSTYRIFTTAFKRQIAQEYVAGASRSFPKILSDLGSRRETESSHHQRGTVQGLLRRAHILSAQHTGTMAPFKPKPPRRCRRIRLGGLSKTWLAYKPPE